MLLVMEFSIAMSKVPIKNRDFDSIQDEIWRDLGFSLLWVPCYFGKGYTISAEIICYCIHIYIYFRWRTYWIRAPPTQDARQCCSYITFLGSGSLWFLRLFLGGAYIQYMIYYSSDKAYLTLRIILPHPPHHHQLFHHRPPTYASYSPNVLPN